MARPINMTEDFQKQCVLDFIKALQLVKASDGKINFTKTFDSVNEKATILFTPLAWSKMVALVMAFDKEVAWHGVARRGDDPEKAEYIVSDIVVYPQEVTGSTVEMDEEAYGKWLMEHGDDERFESLYMQGHSHVKMQTSPSTTDLKHQEDIVGMLGPDQFYIFVILNQYMSHTYRVFDMKRNLLYEDKDIDVKLLDQEGLQDFVKDARTLVKNHVYQAPAKPATTAATGNKPAATTPAATGNKPAATAAAPAKEPEEKKKTTVDDYNYDGYGGYGGYYQGGYRDYWGNGNYCGGGWYGNGYASGR